MKGKIKFIVLAIAALALFVTAFSGCAPETASQPDPEPDPPAETVTETQQYGVFYTLKNAFIVGSIAREELEQLALMQSGELEPEGSLDAETAEKIRSDYYLLMTNPYIGTGCADDESYTPDDVVIEEYFMTTYYKGVVVRMQRHDEYTGEDGEAEHVIDGVSFTESSSTEDIIVWAPFREPSTATVPETVGGTPRHGAFYYLKDAYFAGLVTRDELERIALMHSRELDTEDEADSETAEKIRSDYYRLVRSVFAMGDGVETDSADESEYTLDDVVIEEYFMTAASGASVVRMSWLNGCWGVYIEMQLVIDGISFVKDYCIDDILVWIEI